MTKARLDKKFYPVLFVLSLIGLFLLAIYFFSLKNVSNNQLSENIPEITGPVKYRSGKLIVKFKEVNALKPYSNISSAFYLGDSQNLNNFEVGDSLEKVFKEYNISSVSKLYPTTNLHAYYNAEVDPMDLVYEVIVDDSDEIISRESLDKVNLDNPIDVKMEEIRKKLLEDSNVEYVDFNYIFSASAVPNDTNYSLLWGMQNINAPKAWDITKGNKSVKVAVLDTGVDYTHPDLVKNIAINEDEVSAYKSRITDTNQNGVIDCVDIFNTKNSFVMDKKDDDGNGFVDDICGYTVYGRVKSNNPMDGGMHGTHVAGTVGGVGNNSLGVAGVNWEVSIVPLRMAQGGEEMDLAGGMTLLKYAADNGVKAVNMSWGGPGKCAGSLQQTVTYAYNKGLTMLVAAGNDGGNAGNISPANCVNVITIGAVDQTNTIARFSNRGSVINVVAPGVKVYSTIPGNRYANLDGTSMATPHVTGLVGLMFSKNPNLTPAEVEDLLEKNAKDLGTAGKDNTYGYGLIDAYKVLQAMGGTNPPSSSSASSSSTSMPSSTSTSMSITSIPSSSSSSRSTSRSSSIPSSSKSSSISTSKSSSSSSSQIAQCSKYDLNKDLKVDIKDFVVFKVDYGKVNACSLVTDFKADCFINIYDFVRFRSAAIQFLDLGAGADRNKCSLIV